MRPQNITIKTQKGHPNMTGEKRYEPISEVVHHALTSRSIIQVYDRDPVRTVQLGAFIGVHIREAETMCGPDWFRTECLAKAEPAVLKQIQDEVTRAG